MSNYGSVNPASTNPPDEETDNENHFQETDLLFYKGRTLSQKEKTVKLIKIAVPVFIAVLLIGGLTWLLLGGFGNLYPGPSGSKPPDSSSYGRPIPTPQSTGSTTSTKTTIDTTSTSSKSHSSVSEPVAAAPKESPTTSTSTSTHSSATGGAACSAHSHCDAIGLIGDCCPTTEGTMLDCCS
ncbi:hypothetical protein IV203_017220 [Nitzschia inconspicua]|uniref:Uncharacterized protein n=1 Tax=Nitzschia inconspicua TaxID=303405 RepID=A0A9K3KRJ1_9STRA|nr:hypothetical protein IV203_017220 [Nitzschia inconspicua]